MNISRIVIVIAVSMFIECRCNGEWMAAPRMMTVVTNDFDASDMKVLFEEFETSRTSIKFRLRDGLARMYYQIDDADLSGQESMSVRGRDGIPIILRTDQSLNLSWGHRGLLIRGFSNKTSHGFDFTCYFNAKAFGRGIAVRYGRLLLRDSDQEVEGNELLMVGATELKRKAFGPSNVGKEEIYSIGQFFSSFTDAYNKNKITVIRSMAGESSERWLRWMDGGEKLLGIEVFRCLAGDMITVDAEVSLLGPGDGVYPFPVTFEMSRKNGEFYIEGMRLSPSDKWNQLFDSVVETSEKLIVAINNRELASVEDLLYKKESMDLSSALSDRDLFWIKDAIDRGDRISQQRMIVKCVQGKWMHGMVEVPSAVAGTNIVRKVSFVGSKIGFGICNDH